MEQALPCSYRRLDKNLAARSADVKVLYTEQHTRGLECTVIDEIGHVQAVCIVIAHRARCGTAVRARGVLHGCDIGGPLNEPFVCHTRCIRFRGHVESDVAEINEWIVETFAQRINNHTVKSDTLLEYSDLDLFISLRLISRSICSTIPGCIFRRNKIWSLGNYVMYCITLWTTRYASKVHSIRRISNYVYRDEE